MDAPEQVRPEHCSCATIEKAVWQLEAEGYLSKTKEEEFVNTALLSAQGKWRRRGGERRNEVAVTLFSPPDEVSHWQAACESGRVWLRLLKVAVTKLAGFRMR